MIAVQASGFSTADSAARVQNITTPEESYYSRNLGLVSRVVVQAMDKAMESIVVAALARLLSHILIGHLGSNLK